MRKLTCGFVGFGLIAGSIARALKERNPEGTITIYAYNRSREPLELACKDGIVDRALDDISADFAECDYIFLCAPVSVNNENLAVLKEIITERTILTDVGSVKGSIHEAVRNYNLEKQFIGGHPMTGSERVGYVNSGAALLENAYYILTPTPLSPTDRCEELTKLVASTGALPLVLDEKKHDFATAAISHVPHVLAASLVNFVKDNDFEDGTMKKLAAGGFKDITRIASSSSVMWQQICMTNTDNIVKLLRKYTSALSKACDDIEALDIDAVYNFFSSARIYRDSFAAISSGPIKKRYAVDITIPDVPGSIAQIADLLYRHNINIKNMNIVHSREVAEGTFTIEFYSQEDEDEAALYLPELGFGFVKR